MLLLLKKRIPSFKAFILYSGHIALLPVYNVLEGVKSALEGILMTYIN